MYRPDKPGKSTEKPKSESEKPKSESEKPKSESEKPKSESEKPKSESEKPKSESANERIVSSRKTTTRNVRHLSKPRPLQIDRELFSSKPQSSTSTDKCKATSAPNVNQADKGGSKQDRDREINAVIERTEKPKSESANEQIVPFPITTTRNVRRMSEPRPLQIDRELFSSKPQSSTSTDKCKATSAPNVNQADKGGSKQDRDREINAVIKSTEKPKSESANEQTVPIPIKKMINQPTPLEISMWKDLLGMSSSKPQSSTSTDKCKPTSALEIRRRHIRHMPQPTQLEISMWKDLLGMSSSKPQSSTSTDKCKPTSAPNVNQAYKGGSKQDRDREINAVIKSTEKPKSESANEQIVQFPKPTMRNLRRMSEPSPLERFLGITFPKPQSSTSTDKCKSSSAPNVNQADKGGSKQDRDREINAVIKSMEKPKPKPVEKPIIPPPIILFDHSMPIPTLRRPDLESISSEPQCSTSTGQYEAISPPKVDEAAAAISRQIAIDRENEMDAVILSLKKFFIEERKKTEKPKPKPVEKPIIPPPIILFDHSMPIPTLRRPDLESISSEPQCSTSTGQCEAISPPKVDEAAAAISRQIAIDRENEMDAVILSLKKFFIEERKKEAQKKGSRSTGSGKGVDKKTGRKGKK